MVFHSSQQHHHLLDKVHSMLLFACSVCSYTHRTRWGNLPAAQQGGGDAPCHLWQGGHHPFDPPWLWATSVSITKHSFHVFGKWPNGEAALIGCSVGAAAQVRWVHMHISWVTWSHVWLPFLARSSSSVRGRSSTRTSSSNLWGSSLGRVWVIEASVHFKYSIYNCMTASPCHWRSNISPSCVHCIRRRRLHSLKHYIMLTSAEITQCIWEGEDNIFDSGNIDTFTR